ncbi:hypothetical protein EAH76_19260 [Sphingomonas glacialis]|uniref:Polysaccharide chain length determinant N-terminal domain-containing protein n=2 Tax=Sphingomonas glacialis TaxID=658225 RepID=A0A502FJ57_9SPHN|nr:hypothetical protein EAH76_19260 [Sphingomonas glacialis]
MALRDLLNSVFYHKRAVGIVAGVVLLLGVLAAIVLPPSYRAEAQLLPLSAGVYDMQTANGGPLPSQVLDPAAVANVEMQLLTSLEIHRAVVRKQLGPQASAADVDTALNRFDSHLHVTKVPDANVIELSYTAGDPKVAADALRALLSEYFRSRANVLTSGRVGYLVGQRDKVKAQLDAANAQIATYQQENDVVDVAAQIAGAVTLDDTLRQRKLETDAAIADGRQSLAALQSSVRSVAPQVELYSDNTEAARAIGEMQASIITLQSKRADLASRYMKDAPIVVQVDKQIAGLQASITRQKATLAITRRTGRNQFFDTAQDRIAQARAAVAGAGARRSTLDGQLASSNARLKSLVAIADTVGRLRLQRDVLADTFKTLSTQVEQARVQLNQASGEGGANVRVIEAPTEPSKRSNPPLLLIAGALVAAILLAGVTLLVVTSMRDTFLTPPEVERALDLPVLSAPLGTLAPGVAQREYRKLIAAVDAAGGGGSRTILLLAPHSRMSLQNAALGLGEALNHRAPGQVVLVRFAEDVPVLADGAELEIEVYKGIATAVIGIGRDVSPRLDGGALADLKARYAYVVVTAPPTTLSFEGIELSHTADHVLLVLEAEATRRPVAKDLLSQVLDAGGPVIGAVLLGRRHYIPQWLYGLLLERGSLGKRPSAAEDLAARTRRPFDVPASEGPREPATTLYGRFLQRLQLGAAVRGLRAE